MPSLGRTGIPGEVSRLRVWDNWPPSPLTRYFTLTRIMVGVGGRASARGLAGVRRVLTVAGSRGGSVGIPASGVSAVLPSKAYGVWAGVCEQIRRASRRSLRCTSVRRAVLPSSLHPRHLSVLFFVSRVRFLSFTFPPIVDGFGRDSLAIIYYPWFPTLRSRFSLPLPPISSFPFTRPACR